MNDKTESQRLTMSEYKGMKLLAGTLDGELLCSVLKHLHWVKDESAANMQAFKAVRYVYSQRFGSCPY